MHSPTYTLHPFCDTIPTEGKVITIRKQVAERIRYLRQSKQWTQQYLAEKTNLPGPWSVSRLETRGTDSIATLEIVCKALDVEVWEMLKPDWEVPKDVTN